MAPNLSLLAFLFLVVLPAGNAATAPPPPSSSGNAAFNVTGFLNVTAAAPRGGGAVVFVSAAPGSLVSATFKRAVTAKPYNISVLQISNFVVPPGIVTRPLPTSPPAPRMRQMAIAPSPALTAPPPTLPALQGDASEAPDSAEAPAPSQGHVAKVTSRWIGAAVGMACMLGFL